MTRTTIVVLLAVAAGCGEVGREAEQDVDPGAAASPATTPSTPEPHEGLLYGRVTTGDGDVYEGRLRFGGDEEAFWGHTFNGVKKGNPWAAHVPRGRLPRVRDSIELFGKEIAAWERRIDLGRPVMTRFGDIARIEAAGRRDLRVVLRSGTVVELERFGADDFADGVRVWDDRRGVVDLDEWGIRTIEFLPTARLGAVPDRLHGTVRTRHGDFTGFVQWNRKESVGADALDGHTADGEVSLPFATIRSIARSGDGALVTRIDGGEMVLSGAREVGPGNGGIYVDDPRYGRVLVSWDAFERVDFSPGGPGPAYREFSPGRPLTGAVITRSGRRLAGRLVYDLDESETTETLDAPREGIDYSVPFRLVTSIVLPRLEERGAQAARVTLRSGEALQLELAGDLDAWNAGMLVFVDGRPRPEYVPWSDVERVDFDGPVGCSAALRADQTCPST